MLNKGNSKVRSEPLGRARAALDLQAAEGVYSAAGA